MVNLARGKCLLGANYREVVFVLRLGFSKFKKCGIIIGVSGPVAQLVRARAS